MVNASNRKQRGSSQLTFHDDSIEVSSLQHVVLSSKVHASSTVKSRSDDHSFENDSMLSDNHTAHESQSITTARLRRKQNAKWYMRLLMLLSATLIGFFVSGVVYYAASRGEVDDFEMGFAELGKQVSFTIQERLSQKLVALDSLSVALTSFTKEHIDSDWPTTSLPDFRVRATNSLAASAARSIIVAPLIQNGTVPSWEAYVQAASENWRMEDAATITGASPSVDIIPHQWTNPASALLNDPTTSFRVWQHYPLSTDLIDFDLLSSPTASLLALLSSQELVIGNLMQADDKEAEDPFKAYLSTLAGNADMRGTETLMSSIFYPIFDSFLDESKSIVGVLSMDVFWKDLFSGLVLLGPSDEINCVIRNQCGQVYTLTVKHNQVVKVSKGDNHLVVYDSMNEFFVFNDLEILEQRVIQSDLNDFCLYEVHIYPSATLEDQYLTFKPALYTASAAFCLIMIFIVSLAYERRVAQVNESAVQYQAVVANLFPPAVRRRMFRKQEISRKRQRSRTSKTRSAGFSKARNKQSPALSPQDNMLSPAEMEDLTLMSKPIADHFENSTIIFADIAGFTSWSSSRSPEQVFTLLQTLFNAFDTVAKKRRVFKVETIGDCYLAVCGVPEPQKDHALRMTKFARECLYRVNPLLCRLEGTLGPGTIDLAIRIGLHSGPVTAGVLQGEKSRFQLFGDSVNTAARMESNGEPGRIHISKSTADLLIEAEKGHWLERRKDPIHAKGKGLMETFWIKRNTRHPNKVKTRYQESPDHSDSEGFSDSELLTTSFTSSTSRMSDMSRFSQTSENTWNALAKDKVALYDLPSCSTRNAEEDLIQWHISILESYLKQILHYRNLQGGVARSPVQSRSKSIVRGSCPFDEVSETIPLPTSKLKNALFLGDASSIVLPPQVVDQLKDFVSTIAQSYRQNPFHNFARATHTAMFMNKFIQQIIKRGSSSKEADCLHAIASDPTIQFSLMTAALIHDADHGGIPNDLLSKEQPDFAKIYKGRLIAEQHSLELSWELLMDECFKDLQQCIFSTKAELLRFRQILVNLVLATDSSDSEMSGIRALRWDEAFSHVQDIVPGRGRKQLKVSVAIELLLQVADISHAMQAWSVYVRWSKKLFFEDHDAYIAGRSQADPTKTWYAREAFMFDRHAIPLVEKLASITGWDGLLENIRSNRQEWIVSGKQQVKDFVTEAKILMQGSSSNFHAFGNESSTSSYRFSLRGED